MQSSGQRLLFKDIIKMPLEHYFLLIEATPNRLKLSPHNIETTSFTSYLAHFEMKSKDFARAIRYNANLKEKYGAYFTRPLSELKINWDTFEEKTLREIHASVANNDRKTALQTITDRRNFSSNIEKFNQMLQLLPYVMDYDTLKTITVEDAELRFAGYYDKPVREVIKWYGEVENNPYYYVEKPIENPTESSWSSWSSGGTASAESSASLFNRNVEQQKEMVAEHLHAKIIKFIVTQCILNDQQIPDALKLKIAGTEQDLADIDYMMVEATLDGSMYLNGRFVMFKFDDELVFTTTGSVIPEEQKASVDSNELTPAKFYRLFFDEVYMHIIKLQGNNPTSSNTNENQSSSNGIAFYSTPTSPTLLFSFSEEEPTIPHGKKQKTTDYRR